MENFNQTVVETLQNEVNLLTTKIKVARENHDFGTYKNLILAYKEVLTLYREITGENFANPMNYHIHIDKVTASNNGLDFINNLRRMITIKEN